MADRGESGRTVAGRYQLQRLIGRGGAGAVWRAHDERLDRLVAVKEIVFSAEADDSRARALREARAVARLRDRGVVQIYDAFEDDAAAYLIMELVDAPNLNVLVRRQGPLPPADVAQVGREMLDTLTSAHRMGIVHRDVKPSNVLMDGMSPRLTDFGIARLRDEPGVTASDVVMGTPAYIAPEHARGRTVGPAADLYGLGATLYYAVEGVPPFGETGSLPTLMAVVRKPPRPTARAGPLDDLLRQLLAKNPHERPNVAEVRRRLRSAAAWQSDDAAIAAGAAGATANGAVTGGGTVGVDTGQHPTGSVAANTSTSGEGGRTLPDTGEQTVVQGDEPRPARSGVAPGATSTNGRAHGVGTSTVDGGTAAAPPWSSPSSDPDTGAGRAQGARRPAVMAVALAAVLAVVLAFATLRGDGDDTEDADEARPAPVPAAVAPAGPSPSAGPSEGAPGGRHAVPGADVGHHDGHGVVAAAARDRRRAR
jgi:hypothetical protein